MPEKVEQAQGELQTLRLLMLLGKDKLNNTQTFKDCVVLLFFFATLIHELLNNAFHLVYLSMPILFNTGI